MQIDLSPERIKELENEDIYAQSGGLVDTLGDIGQGSARGILKIPGQFADNMNGILDWTADKLIGEGDYRLQEVDKVKDWYQDKLNTYIPPEDTTAFKTSEAISNALASFLLLRKVVPIQNWFARSAVAEAGASLVRDPYEERLADIMADVLESTTSPLKDKTFDAVLLDAPCSATGTIRRHPDLPLHRREKDVLKLTEIQKDMLKRADQWVRVGGLLAYATCSLDPREGEAQMKDFLEQNPNYEACAPTGLPEDLCGHFKEGSEFGYLRTTPADWRDKGGMDGFFAGVLRKIKG